jgi:hypothetical protein
VQRTLAIVGYIDFHTCETAQNICEVLPRTRLCLLRQLTNNRQDCKFKVHSSVQQLLNENKVGHPYRMLSLTEDKSQDREVIND